MSSRPRAPCWRRSVGSSRPPTPAAPGQSLFGPLLPAVPAASGDTSSIELGTAFSVSTAGSATGVRFYKGTGNTGTHVGSLWTAAGERLAEVTFTDETATGWQTATLPGSRCAGAGAGLCGLVSGSQRQLCLHSQRSSRNPGSMASCRRRARTTAGTSTGLAVPCRRTRGTPPTTSSISSSPQHPRDLASIWPITALLGLEDGCCGASDGGRGQYVGAGASCSARCG